MLLEVSTHVVDALKAAGLTAAADPRDLSLPGIWVTPDTISTLTLTPGPRQVTLTLVAIASAGGTRRALQDLDALLTATEANLDVDGTWTATSIRLPNHGGTDPLPALRTTITLEWTP